MENVPALIVESDFDHETFIPIIYSCEGSNTNPEIIVGNIPERAKSLAIIMDDPDAPMGTFVHWVAWNIPVGNIIVSSSGTGLYMEGINSTKMNGYTGPCPPHGHGIHHYHFKVYALDTMLDLEPTTDKDGLIKAMESHVVLAGRITGLFERK